MGTPVEIATLTTGTANCSPVTEFYNTSTSTDYIFLSVTADANTASPISCSGGSEGCLISFITTTPLSDTSTAAAALTEPGGTSGIVIDNALTNPTGTSNVYFTPLSTSETCAGNSAGTGAGTGGCAVQASQSGLD